MLLAYDAQEADISAYPGKFKPDSANPTGLFVPRLNGLFARYWTPGASEGAGAWHRDEIRNLTGNIGEVLHSDAASGVMREVQRYGDRTSQDGNWTSGFVAIDASLSVPTGPENVPRHVWQPVALYLGRSAEIDDAR